MHGWCDKCKPNGFLFQFETTRRVHNWRDHVSRPHDRIRITCQKCGETFRQQTLYSSHMCEAMKDPVNPQFYNLLHPNSDLAKTIRGLPPLDVLTITQQLKLAIPETSPPVSVPAEWVKWNFKDFSNPSGVSFIENALMDKVTAGGENSLLLHRNIEIIRGPDLYNITLTDRVTAMKSHKLVVEEHNADYWKVSLRYPPTLNGNDENQPLDEKLKDLPIYQQ